MKNFINRKLNLLVYSRNDLPKINNVACIINRGGYELLGTNWIIF